MPGQQPTYMLQGVTNVDSSTLDARQQEKTRFGVVAYQASPNANFDYQVAFFNRWTDLHYGPDPVGDLVFNGVAATITRRNSAGGLQADSSYRLGDSHVLRTGLFLQRETFTVDSASTVFPADSDGNQTSDVPISIPDSSLINGHLWGVYVQDEWQATKALTVNYGLRYDKVATVVDESQLSPRIGVVYDVSNDLRVHAGYARYFTPPPTEKIDTTSVQKFIGTTNALPSDANTAVRSERSNYYDVGAAYQLTSQVTLGVLPQGPALAGRRTVRQRLDLLGVQLRTGADLGHRVLDDVPRQSSLGLRQSRLHPGQGQDGRDRPVQFRPGRAGLHQRELGSPRP